MKFSLFRKTPKKVGDAPGTVVYVGAERSEEIKLDLTVYDKTNFSENEISEEQLSTISQHSGMRWLNVSGIHKPDLIEKIGKELDIHKLILEDIVNTIQQPKIEEYSDSIYVVLKMFYVNSKDEIKMEHIKIGRAHV